MGLCYRSCQGKPVHDNHTQWMMISNDCKNNKSNNALGNGAMSLKYTQQILVFQKEPVSELTARMTPVISFFPKGTHALKPISCLSVSVRDNRINVSIGYSVDTNDGHRQVRRSGPVLFELNHLTENRIAFGECRFFV